MICWVYSWIKTLFWATKGDVVYVILNWNLCNWIFFLSSFETSYYFFSQNQKLKTQDTTIYISCSLYWMNFVGYIKIVGFFCHNNVLFFFSSFFWIKSSCTHEFLLFLYIFFGGRFILTHTLSFSYILSFRRRHQEKVNQKMAKSLPKKPK